jgi:hypothetical protein
MSRINRAERAGRRRFRSAFPLVGVILTASSVAAGTLRCGDDLIQRGFTFFEVQERCGKPDLAYDWDRNYVPGVQAQVTEWIYEQGTSRFRRVLTFEEGRLRSIELRPKPEASIESLK